MSRAKFVKLRRFL